MKRANASLHRLLVGGIVGLASCVVACTVMRGGPDGPGMRGELALSEKPRMSRSTTACHAGSVPACRASLHTLVMHVDVDSRRFLLATHQRVIFAFADGLGRDTVVATHVMDPFGDRTEVAIERCWWAYVSLRVPAPFKVIAPPLTMRVEVGQAYVFDGVALKPRGVGVPEFVVVHNEAPPSTTQPLTVGLAVSIHDLDSASTPAVAVDHHLLNRFEARLIPTPRPELLVFIASEVQPGMVLPRRVLAPVTRSATISDVRSSYRRDALEIGRYLTVDLSAPEQSVIHFELDENAFGYGEGAS